MLISPRPTRRRALSLMLGASAAPAVAGLAAPAAAAPYDARRMDEIPDFSQTDPRLGLPNGGRMYCAPVAAANAIVWLALDRGRRALLPATGVTLTDRVAHVALELGSPRLMSTAPKGGTRFDKFASGLDSFAADHGYRPHLRARTIWGELPGYTDGRAPLSADWLIKRFRRREAVWAAIGFYRIGRRDELERLNGHMITLVGYGVRADGGLQRDMLVFHDSDDGDPGARRQHFLFDVERYVKIALPDRRVHEVPDAMVLTQGLALRDGYVALLESGLGMDV